MTRLTFHPQENFQLQFGFVRWLNENEGLWVNDWRYGEGSAKTAVILSMDEIDEMTEQVNEIEDAILTGGGAAREHLARIRRRCVRLRRVFGPERTALQKLDRQRPAWVDDEAAEQWHDATETLAFLLDDQSELYERAKLLQEEIASRVAEDTNRNLYVLSVLSAVLLPMTLVTGIFGMNTAGLPFQSLPGGTWYAGGLCVAAIALAWWFLRRGGIGRGS